MNDLIELCSKLDLSVSMELGPYPSLQAMEKTE